MGSKPGPRGYGLDQVAVRFPGAPRVDEGEIEDPGGRYRSRISGRQEGLRPEELLLLE